MAEPADECWYSIRSLAVDYAAGSRTRPHSHGWPQLLYARRGAVVADVEGDRWVVPPRHGLWIPAGCIHALRMSRNLALRTLYVRPQTRGVPEQPSMRFVSALLHEAILATCDAVCLDERNERQRALAELVRQELTAAADVRIALRYPLDARARRLAEALAEPAAAGAAAGGPAAGGPAAAEETSAAPTIDRLCLDAGLSRRTAERVFVEETGLSPARWRRQARLNQSIADLAAGMEIFEVALRAGYRSRSAFYDAFGKAFGFTPGQVPAGW